MYGTLLRNYEAVKEDYSLIRKRYDDLVSSHSAAVNKLEHSQVSTSRYSILYCGSCYLLYLVICEMT